MLISNVFHPRYLDNIHEYTKWRYTYQGGREFIHKYLEKFDIREDEEDFKKRRNMTYLPAFPKRGINKIKNSLYQRMSEITRKGGSKSYQDAVNGKNQGVDMEGSDMDTFLGQKILPELLSMSRVGVYVDRPGFDAAATLAQFNGIQPDPYLYYYFAEDIVNWSYIYRENELYYTHLLLRETETTLHSESGLPADSRIVYRFFRLTNEGVSVQTYQPQGLDKHGKPQDDILLETKLLNLKRIPFVLYDIKDSLLRETADYQVALLNLSSSDLHYALKSNFLMYTEQYDPRTEDLFRKRGPIQLTAVTEDGSTEVIDSPNLTGEKDKELRVGTTKGRRYPVGAERPAWIHPSPEPLRVSMEKQTQMKEEIDQLLDICLIGLAKDKGEGVEGGLAAIGLELQRGEKEIAKIWEDYFGNKEESAQVVYPTTYTLKTDEQRIDEAIKQNEIKTAVPSKTCQKLVAKKIASTLFEGRISPDELELIHSEVDQANYITSDPEHIKIDIELGLVTAETASNARGYDGTTEVPKAQKEHAERLARLAISQTEGAAAARGGDADAQDTSAKDEKKLSQDTGDLKTKPGQKLTRGKA